MTTTEHLQRIRARCVELLAIAEKRTPGKWGVERTQTTNWIGPMRRSGDGKINLIVCDTDRDGLKAEFLEQNDGNSTFIAACAGSSEAGWRSTIAAIDAYNRLAELADERSDMGMAVHIGHLYGSLITAWPEELI